MLGIVSDEYEVVDNRDAFRFLDALIGSEMHFETAGSLWGGRRVWCLARLPEYVELGGDLVRDLHLRGQQPRRVDGRHRRGDADPDRLREHARRGATSAPSTAPSAQRTFRFRHTGNLQAKFAEARQVLGMTIDYAAQFKVLADRLAREPITPDRARALACSGTCGSIDEDMGKLARANRERTIDTVLDDLRRPRNRRSTRPATAPAPSGSR